MSKKLRIFVLQNGKSVKTLTTYEAISIQKALGGWDLACSMSPHFQTLDRYYQYYTAVLLYEPERSRGYRSRICANSHNCSKLWGGVSTGFART